MKKNGKEPSKDIALLKLELEEAKKIEDTLKQQLTEDKNRCATLEEELVTTRKELEKFQALYHQNMSNIKALEESNNILSKQRSPLLKTCLGYEEGSSSNHSERKKSGKWIKIQSNKQSEYEHTLQTKENENEISIRIGDFDQKDQSRFA